MVRGIFMTKKVIMTSDDIRRTLSRIAHEIIEQNGTSNNLILIGIHTRGVPLAKRLASNIETFEHTKIPSGSLDISLYRDDRSTLAIKTTKHSTDIPTDIRDKSIVLVDDVLYTGRTTRAAIDTLLDQGRPQSVRSVREVPMRMS